MNIRIGKAGLKLIKSFEGIKLKAYQDQKGVWTIGYGHTGGVKEGDKISKAQALVLLDKDLDRFEDAVCRLVKVKLTQNQFDALVSFAYNCGEGNLEKSTLLEYVNQKRFASAAEQFQNWNKIRIKGVLTPSKGLTRRRKAEKALFIKK
jgi:lysozyme